METKTNKEDAAAKRDGGKFREFFIDQLKDIYWAEKALCEALPKMAKAATSEKLAKGFEKHTKETEEQARRLEKMFELLGEKAETKKCEAMAGLVKEAEEIIEETEKGTYTRDAGLVIAGQKVEHYEIASYGALVVFAEQMGETKVAELLKQTLEEEKNTDMTLTTISEDQVNEKAVQE